MLQKTDSAIFSAAPEVISTFEHAGKRYVLECLNSGESMQDMREQWIALETRCSEKYTYFQTFDWCMKWVNAYVSEPSKNQLDIPQVFVLRDADPSGEDDVLMIWPLFKTRSRAGTKVLITLGEPQGQYSGILYDREHFPVELGKKVYEQIRASIECDAFTLNFFADNSIIAQILDGEGFLDKSEQKSMILDLEGMESWESYRNTLASSNRKQRNKRRNKLNKMGNVTYKVYSSGEPEFQDLVRECLAMKQVWMQQTGRREDVMTEPAMAEFLSSLGNPETANPNNDAFMHVLALDAVPVAMEMGMAFQGHYYSFLGAINMDFQKLSPGKIQIEMAQEWAKEQGLKKFDFLNDPSGYKATWTNETQFLRSQYVPISSAGYLYCWMWKTSLKPKLKEMYQNIRPDDRRFINHLFKFVGKLQGKSSG